MQRAEEMDRPSYFVFSNAMLVDLVSIRPQTIEGNATVSGMHNTDIFTVELRDMKGFGDKKVEDFGAEICAICSGGDVPPRKRDDVEEEAEGFHPDQAIAATIESSLANCKLSDLREMLRDNAAKVSNFTYR